MAELLQLDAAAALVGKSEVTLRRLIKAGKIPVQKQKTLTGFIYLVDARDVKNYYQDRGDLPEEEVGEAPAAHAASAAEPAPAPEMSVKRVAVANGDNGPSEYWQKRAESYEDKYYQEVHKHAQAREELGLWRGRAEHAQAMLMKMLPASPEVAVSQQENAVPVPPKQEESSKMLALLTVVVVASFILLVGGALYFLATRL